MKTIILYTRRNVGLIALSYLVAKGHMVRVLTDDQQVKWLAKKLNCGVISGFDQMGDYDLFLSVHGWKIVPDKYLNEGKAVNVHPCLFKFKGHDPIARYIANGETLASVGAHQMTSVVDEGELVYEEFFDTPVCKNYADFYNVAFYHYFTVIDKILEQVL